MQYRFDELLQRMVYDLGIGNVDLPRVVAIAEEIAALDVELVYFSPGFPSPTISFTMTLYHEKGLYL